LYGRVPEPNFLIVTDRVFLGKMGIGMEKRGEEVEKYPESYGMFMNNKDNTS
jgi:hypothetical protein